MITCQFNKTLNILQIIINTMLYKTIVEHQYSLLLENIIKLYYNSAMNKYKNID